MLKIAAAIRHVAFEDLAGFELVLMRAGYDVHYYDVGVGDLQELHPLKPDLLFVLGGPIGAYEDDRYPFLSTEIGMLEARLAAGLPTMGICLGAQLIARALGARVYPGPAKEIGFAPLTLTEDGGRTALSAFADNPVLHWHGDTFDLPQGCRRLASTDFCVNQAFSFGPATLAMQFHPEVDGHSFERWLIGHTLELAQAGIDVPVLRARNAELAPRLGDQTSIFLLRWLKETAGVRAA